MLQLRLKEKIQHVSKYIGDTVGFLKQWDKSEDVLTSSVFGMAMYLPYEILLGPILAGSTPIKGGQKFPAIYSDDDIENVGLWVNEKELHQQAGHAYPKHISGKPLEPDGIVLFNNSSLIIEAKKEDETDFCKRNQIENYFRFISGLPGRENFPIWLLAVGGNPKARASLRSVTVPDNCNLLYVDWKEIMSLLDSTGINAPSYAVRLFADILEYARKRKVIIYFGFLWPKNVGRFIAHNDIENSIRCRWFQPQKITWPNLPPSKIVIALEKLGNWRPSNKYFFTFLPFSIDYSLNSWFQRVK